LFVLQAIVCLVAADVNPDQDLYRRATRLILGLVPGYQWTFFTDNDNPTMRSRV